MRSRGEEKTLKSHKEGEINMKRDEIQEKRGEIFIMVSDEAINDERERESLGERRLNIYNLTSSWFWCSWWWKVSCPRVTDAPDSCEYGWELKGLCPTREYLVSSYRRQEPEQNRGCEGEDEHQEERGNRSRVTDSCLIIHLILPLMFAEYILRLTSVSLVAGSSTSSSMYEWVPCYPHLISLLSSLDLIWSHSSQVITSCPFLLWLLLIKRRRNRHPEIMLIA